MNAFIFGYMQLAAYVLYMAGFVALVWGLGNKWTFLPCLAALLYLITR